MFQSNCSPCIDFSISLTVEIEITTSTQTSGVPEYSADNFEQQRAISSLFFFIKLKKKIDALPPNPFCQVVALREHLVSGSMVMTKAAVREEVSRASPTLHCHFTETGKNLFDLYDLLDPFGLIAGGSQSRRETRLFFSSLPPV